MSKIDTPLSLKEQIGLSTFLRNKNSTEIRDIFIDIARLLAFQHSGENWKVKTEKNLFSWRMMYDHVGGKNVHEHKEFLQ
jgi:hypothetical protein